MASVFFVTPMMIPIECQPQPPVIYYPIKNVTFRFPIPVFYSTPPAAVL